MQQARGGRFVLRLVEVSSEAVRYAGTFESDAEAGALLIRVGLPGGSVELTSPGSATPSWLAEQARAALRAAFRATQSGAAWPRRVSRWRQAREPSGSGDERP